MSVWKFALNSEEKHLMTTTTLVAISQPLIMWHQPRRVKSELINQK